MKKYYILVGVIYLTIVGLAFFLNIKPLLFFLSIPWSMVVAFLGFLLIHMFENFQFSYLHIVGALLNLLIFFKLTLFKADYPSSDKLE